MNPHTRIYLDHFGHQIPEDVKCEVCRRQATEVHHIIFKSQQGEDKIENLMALCRECHERAHFRREPWIKRGEAQEIHGKRLTFHKKFTFS